MSMKYSIRSSDVTFGGQLGECWQLPDWSYGTYRVPRPSPGTRLLGGERNVTMFAERQIVDNEYNNMQKTKVGE
jgi:hypothetical protein